MKHLVVVHVYYPGLWHEIAQCISNITDSFDLYVTYSDSRRFNREEVLRDFPFAKIIPCCNKGFDIWPFLKVLQSVDLDNYGLVIKLHTKRDVPDADWQYLRAFNIGKSNWRNNLLAFLKSPKAWAATRRRFLDKHIAMVADHRCICGKPFCASSKEQARLLNAGLSFCEKLYGTKLPEDEVRFVAGTMFAARAAVFKRLAAQKWAEDDFGVSCHDGQETLTLAHIIERVLGFITTAEGMTVCPFNGSYAISRFKELLLNFYRSHRDYIFDAHRINGRLLVKLFTISIYRAPKISSRNT